MTAGPTPCTAASGIAKYYGSYTADQLASYYGFDPLYSLGDFGQGVSVALVEFEPDLSSDIAAYQACYGTNATVNYIDVDGGAGSGAGSGEAALDIEDVIGLAPEATIDVQEPALKIMYPVYGSASAETSGTSRTYGVEVPQ
jgi:subtilase family serine protease